MYSVPEFCDRPLIAGSKSGLPDHPASCLWAILAAKYKAVFLTAQFHTR
jgi:hypothetical protein